MTGETGQRVAGRGWPHPFVLLAGVVAAVAVSALALLSTRFSSHVVGWISGSVVGLTLAGLVRRADTARVERGIPPVDRKVSFGLYVLMLVSFGLGMAHAFYLGWEVA